MHVELAASSELQLTRAVLAVVPVLIHGELGQVQLPGADVATPRARVSSRPLGHLDLNATKLGLTFDRGGWCMHGKINQNVERFRESHLLSLLFCNKGSPLLLCSSLKSEWAFSLKIYIPFRQSDQYSNSD